MREVWFSQKTQKTQLEISCGFRWSANRRRLGGCKRSGSISVLNAVSLFSCVWMCNSQQEMGYDNCSLHRIVSDWSPNQYCWNFDDILLHRKNVDDVDILVGTNDLTVGGERYPAEKLIQHNGFDIPRWANNIALIRVEDTIDFHQFVQPIEYSMEEVRPGSILQFSMFYVR